MVTFLEISLIFSLRNFMQYPIEHLPSGPLSVILPFFVNYFMDMPRITQSHFLGIPITGKTLTYVLGFQVISSSAGSLVTAACSLIAGIICRSNILGITDCFQIPKPVANLAHTLFGWLLETESAPDDENLQMGATIEIQRQQQMEIYEQQLMYDRAREMMQHQRGHAARRDAPGTDHSVAGPSSRNASSAPIDEVQVQTLVDMGFNRNNVIRALLRSNNDLNAATNMLLSEA
jgi:hypothetical protein